MFDIYSISYIVNCLDLKQHNKKHHTLLQNLNLSRLVILYPINIYTHSVTSQIFKSKMKRIRERGAKGKAVLRLFINCPFVCIFIFL